MSTIIFLLLIHRRLFIFQVNYCKTMFPDRSRSPRSSLTIVMPEWTAIWLTQSSMAISMAIFRSIISMEVSALTVWIYLRDIIDWQSKSVITVNRRRNARRAWWTLKSANTSKSSTTVLRSTTNNYRRILARTNSLMNKRQSSRVKWLSWCWSRPFSLWSSASRWEF